MNVKLTRRELLRTAGLVAAGTGLAACAPQVVEVEKEVTRVVEETRLVVQERPVTPPGTLPIVSEPTTLEMAVKSVSNVTDFDTHPFWVWLQEQTGVKLDFVVIPDAEATTDGFVGERATYQTMPRSWATSRISSLWICCQRIRHSQPRRSFSFAFGRCLSTRRRARPMLF